MDKEPEILTWPRLGVQNYGLDNEEGNLVCCVNDLLEGAGNRYKVVDLLGTGTFGQVFKCWDAKRNILVAVKIIKNKPAYYAQGLIEIDVVRTLNSLKRTEFSKHIVEYKDSFEFKNHLCLVFEILKYSLLDILTENGFRCLPLTTVQPMAVQILRALSTLEDANIIHCDLKPENILVADEDFAHSYVNIDGTEEQDDDEECSNHGDDKDNDGVEGAVQILRNIDNIRKSDSINDATVVEPALIREGGEAPAAGAHKQKAWGEMLLKVIDFGSACSEGRALYSYVQSRFCK